MQPLLGNLCMGVPSDLYCDSRQLASLIVQNTLSRISQLCGCKSPH